MFEDKTKIQVFIADRARYTSSIALCITLLHVHAFVICESQLHLWLNTATNSLWRSSATYEIPLRHATGEVFAKILVLQNMYLLIFLDKEWSQEGLESLQKFLKQSALSISSKSRPNSAALQNV